MKQAARALCRAGAAALALFATGARGEELQTYRLVLKNHKFAPVELKVPAGKPFALVIVNQDDATDEFEMNSPSLEKLVQPGAEGQVRVRPLAPGRFTFFDDFHPEARGVIVAQ